jgi:hypothetical protein
MREAALMTGHGDIPMQMPLVPWLRAPTELARLTAG